MSNPGSSKRASKPAPHPAHAHAPDLRTRLLSESHDSHSDAGTFASIDTPRSGSPVCNESIRSNVSGRPNTLPKPHWLRRATKTTVLAEEAGVKRPWLMYASYYIPCIAWVGSYEPSLLIGDVVAGITMASFYIPMALSLSANLAHLPPIHGLYAFAIQPLVYAVLGSCPTMAVGPEAAGSLLMGSVIRTINEHHRPAFDDDGGEGDTFQNARLAGVVTVMAGTFASVAGILRLGFLDSVLSKPLLRGFISGVGFVIFVDQLLPEMGLIPLAIEDKVTRAPTMTKLLWIFKHLSKTHSLTFAVASVSFFIIMVGREFKRQVGSSRRYKWVVFLPDRFLVVVLGAVFTYCFGWYKNGLEILGEVKTDGSPFQFFPPFSVSHLNYAKEAMSTAFLIAVLGFFESVVAAKSLGTTLDISISSNRELIALGVANITGGCFQALPAFGGYGRSKVNKATGGHTPLSSVVLSVCTIICVHFLLPYFYYLPRSVLCAMISVVGISLLEEAPADIIFFLKLRAYSDLATMALVFLTTLLWSITTGIAIGVGISLIQVIRHSTRARIQILGYDRASSSWEPIEEGTPTNELEQTPNTVVIKIRESLTFANSGDLSRKLWRVDRYGDSRAHPSLPRLRQEVTCVVFDVAGVSTIDGSGAQVLRHIVKKYVDRNVDVWFARVSGGEEGAVWDRIRRAGVEEYIGGKERLVGSVQEALRRHEGNHMPNTEV